MLSYLQSWRVNLRQKRDQLRGETVHISHLSISCLFYDERIVHHIVQNDIAVQLDDLGPNTVHCSHHLRLITAGGSDGVNSPWVNTDACFQTI
jgi:hypothetical protein